MKHVAKALALALATAIAMAAGGCDADRAPGPASDAVQAEAGAPPADAGVVSPPTPTPAPAPGAGVPDPNATIPDAFQGTWAADALACRVPAHESRLVLQANRVAFHEGAGPVKSAVVDGNDITVLAELTSEGQTDEATYAFHLSDDGNTLTDISTGPGMVRQRCADVAAR
ncbi:hypothetical protein [Cognatiluteimonas profundi]|uniref:hypothetical protein n=1 Tax=Cognatiluteimonas profundi TaxID=2594501 RepID=UPI00131EB814|nr:hypothetical protein [Lysobacter profundi]